MGTWKGKGKNMWMEWMEWMELEGISNESRQASKSRGKGLRARQGKRTVNGKTTLQMMKARVQRGKVRGETRIAKMLIIAMPFAIVGTKFSEAQLSAEELKPWQYCDFAKGSQYFSLPRQQVIAPDSMFSVFALVALVALVALSFSKNHLVQICSEFPSFVSFNSVEELQVLSPRQKTKAEVKSPPSRTSESWRVVESCEKLQCAPIPCRSLFRSYDWKLQCLKDFYKHVKTMT